MAGRSAYKCECHAAAAAWHGGHGVAAAHKHCSLRRATIESTVSTLRSIVQESAFSSTDNDFYDANFPTDAEGRTLHLGTKASPQLMQQ